METVFSCGYIESIDDCIDVKRFNGSFSARVASMLLRNLNVLPVLVPNPGCFVVGLQWLSTRMSVKVEDILYRKAVSPSI